MELKKSDKANLEKKKGLFLQIGLVTVLALLLIAFEWTTREVTTGSLGELSDVIMEEEIIPITRPEEIQPPPPPPPPQVTEVLNIVEDDVDIDDELFIDDVEARADTRIDFTGMVFDEEDEAEEQEIFFIVEDMPDFQGGGQDGFRKYIAENLRYPQIAAENGIQGRVFVQFVVNADGNVSDATVVRGVDPSLDREAVRVVMSSPRWTPGRQRGEPVRVAFTFPINFVLQ
ncbi:MAG: energy transducer TonB [Marinilabiliales bacterium]|nr:MAG: energy transducer TonB [Marinilabiliales bacterium]